MEKSKNEILLVEDDADDAEMTIHALKKNNFSFDLIHVDDGVKALEYLFDDNNALPVLILLDLKMPKVDGIQVLRKLKNDPARRRVPVAVLISSKEGKGYVESFQLKADAYLMKPVSAQNFLVVLNETGLLHLVVNG